MNAAELQEMQAKVAAALSNIDTSYRPSPDAPTSPRYGPFHEAAAVLSLFDRATLKPVAPPQEGQTIDVLLADSAVVQDPEHGSWWTLLPDVRQAVIQQMGSREALLRALTVNPEQPRNLLQATLEAYIRGDAPALEVQNAAQLTCTYQVVDWLKGVVDGLPDQAAIMRQRDLLGLLQPFYDLAGTHFRGRQAELKTLRSYVGVLPPGSVGERVARFVEQVRDLRKKPPLVIWGPGGMGKSALLSRFIWEHKMLPNTERFPWTYIDFDRPGMLAEEPRTLLLEAVRQLGLQYPEAHEFCDRLRRDWQQRLSGRARQIRSMGVKTSRGRLADATVNTSQPAEWEPFLSDFASLLDHLKVEQAPFLFVLDTFEEVQYRSEIAVQGFAEFLKVFQRHVPTLRSVLAGRAPIDNIPDFPTTSIELTDFDAEAAQGFLETHGIPGSLAATIAAQIGGNPLSLKLAFDVWRLEGAGKEGIANLQTRYFFYRLKESEIQGQLFKRILSHIHDSDVRKLAYPGLVLRRVTPELIREVLAEPCGVIVRDLAHAQQLFDEMRREVSLVSYEDGALRHRSDVRRVMIHLLREAAQDKVRRIEEAAIAYYQRQDGVIARAEEIYHRLSLKHSTAVIDRCWVEGVQPYLYSALEELNAHEYAWLAPRLGYHLTPEQRKQADVESWERDAEQLVWALLQRDQVREALDALHERDERTPGSPLYALEAEVWERLDNWSQAWLTIERGIASADAAGNRWLGVSLRLRGARVDTRRGDFEAALQKLDDAETLAADDDVHTLAIILNRLVLQRIVGDAPSARIALIDTLRERFNRLSNEQVAEQPLLMGSIARELGAEYPDVLHRIVRFNGLETERQSLLRALATALAAWDNQAVAEAKRPQGLLARHAGLPEAPSSRTVWTTYVLTAEPEQLSQVIVGLLNAYPDPPTEVWQAIADILGERATELVTLAPADAPAVQTIDRAASRAPTTVPESLSASSAGLRLTGPQLKQFQEALLAAFDRDSLAQMVRYRLNRSLEAISLSDNMQDTAFQLIRWAETMSITAQLLTAAREARPDNPQLLAFAAQFGLASTSMSEKELQQFLIDSNSALDIAEWRSRLGQLETRICRVELADQTFGTGFLLGPDIVMTAFRVIEPVFRKQIPLEQVQLCFDYKQLADGTTTNPGTHYHPTAEWLIDFRPYSASDTLRGEMTQVPAADELDYALVRVAGTPGYDPVGREHAEPDAAPRGWIELPRRAYRLSPQQPLMILQHLPDGPLNLSVARNAILGVNANSTRVRYRIDTQSGSPGSPCFDQNWELVALHHALGQGYGQGIPITAIVDLLRTRGMLRVLGEQAL
jgi:hypothetical protein